MFNDFLHILGVTLEFVCLYSLSPIAKNRNAYTVLCLLAFFWERKFQKFPKIEATCVPQILRTVATSLQTAFKFSKITLKQKSSYGATFIKYVRKNIEILHPPFLCVRVYVEEPENNRCTQNMNRKMTLLPSFHTYVLNEWSRNNSRKKLHIPWLDSVSLILEMLIE